MTKLPKGWKLEKIGNLCEVGRGSSPRPIADSRYFEGGTIPWIKIADATKSGKYLYETKEHVNEFGASFSRLMPKGSLIVAASGTLGYTQLLGVDGCVHDGWLYLTNYNGVEKDFLYYFFHAQKEFFFNSAYGAAIQNINTMIMRDMEIALPPLLTQRRIADILSAYDALIENNMRRIRILDGMAQAIYQEWFGKVDKESLPEGWTIRKLGEITSKIGSGATPTGGKNSYKENGISLIRSLNVYDFNFSSEDLAFITDKQADKLSNVTVEKHDVLLNITGASVARCCMVPSFVLPARVNQHVAIIRADPDLTNPFYILYTLNHESKKMELLNLAQGGATREALTKSTLENYEVIQPPRKLLDKFGVIVESMFRQHEILTKKNANLRQTRDLLLPRLVSGEVAVNGL